MDDDDQTTPRHLPLFKRYRLCFVTRSGDVSAAISPIVTTPWAGHMASGHEIS